MGPHPCPREVKSHQKQKRKWANLCLNYFTKAALRERASAKRKRGRTQQRASFGGAGLLVHAPTACWGGPRWAQDYRGPAALPQTSPPLTPSLSRLAIDRGCDMVDQYGRDIKPAGCLPASVSLSTCLASLSRSRTQAPHPQAPLTHASVGPGPPITCPYSGRA